MFDSIRHIFADKKMRQRIFFTLLMLLACRIGAQVQVPGINSEVAMRLIKTATGGSQNLFQLMDVFSGGAFAQMTIIALGVMPYISSSIFMQVAVALLPSLKREVEQNPTVGRRKIATYTRFLTIALALSQSGLFARFALQLNASNPGVILDEIVRIQAFGTPWLFYLIMMSTMTAGTVLLMWVGEQISDKERGVGNGMSLIIAIGILSSLPSTIGTIIRQLNLESQEPGQMSFTSLLLLGSVFVFIVLGTILIIQGQRKIPLQYAGRRLVRGEMGSNKYAYIPLKINYAGVVPVIFASTLLMFPATIGQFIGRGNWFGKMAIAISPGNWPYTIAYVMLIFLFTYVWTSTQFHPEQIARDLQSEGGFIPGVRQGEPTARYLFNTMSHITFMGALFLALIAVLPTLVGRILGVDATISYFFGGTSLLILVGVVIDTKNQIDTALISDKYQGKMRLSSFRSR